MSQTNSRPGQATFAGWLIIGGSIALVIGAWQRIAGLHTLEGQEELRRVLAEPPLSELGVTVDALSETVRILSMVAAAGATASAILGWYALRRSTHARLALSVLAPVVLIGGFATAGFFAPLVVAGVVMLWVRPTRDWFAGRPWSTAGPDASRRDPFRRPDPFNPPPDAHRTVAPVPAREGEPGADEPRPATGPTAAGPSEQPGPASTPYAENPPYPVATRAPYLPPPPTARRRPATLVWACTVAWVSCGLVAGMMLVTALVMAVARDQLFAELERQQGTSLDSLGVSEGDVVVATYVLAAIVVPWCVAAVVLAVLTFRGLGWARIALVVCSSAAGLASLAFAVVSPLLGVVAGAAAITTWLLLRREVAAWFRR